MNQQSKHTDSSNTDIGHKKHSPVIILPGINHSPTFLYDEQDNQIISGGSHIGGTLLILNKEKLTANTAFKFILRLLAAIITQTGCGIDKFVYELICDILKYQRCDKDGNYIENLKTKRWNYSLKQMTTEEKEWVYLMVPMQTLVEEIGEESVYFFTFNLVGDPMKSADELDDYIETVKEQTGCDKVTLMPISLGGTILAAYLDKYGHKNIDQIVNIVACLNGTDIAGDIYAREWRLDDEYLYHQFLAKVFAESDGVATKGYLINVLLHLFPRAAVNGLLSGAIDAVLDTLMLNCPQFWAMIPSYRYDELAERYLSDNPALKARTDKFQYARLSLNQNLLAAASDGVRVDSIACANLSFGEQMYTFFNIVDKADKVNSDGIVNLSSATLGATGAPIHKTLLNYEYEKISRCDIAEHKHISADYKVDVSTALFPENTWIFLNQHHEVGGNDVVINLAKAIILGKISDVNDNPMNYPQFNADCYTQNLRRRLLPDADKIDKNKLSACELAQLNAAVTEAQAVLRMTVADKVRAEAAEKQLVQIFQNAGANGYTVKKQKNLSVIDSLFENIMSVMSKGAFKILGGGSLIDRTVHIFKKFKNKKEV